MHLHGSGEATDALSVVSSAAVLSVDFCEGGDEDGGGGKADPGEAQPDPVAGALVPHCQAGSLDGERGLS